MQEETELWKQLCAQTAVEQNPERRLDLIRQSRSLSDDLRKRAP
jgi:hypothetical protein